MEEYEPDQQQTQQLDSDEESFHTAPSNILNIPTEEMPKPGKRACGSMDSGVGDGGRSSFSSSCSGSLRGREYDSGVCVCVCVCVCMVWVCVGVGGCVGRVVLW